MKKAIATFLMLVLISVLSADAQDITRKKFRKFEVDSVDHVLVNDDTVATVIPMRNLGRFDRGLYNYLFCPKGKWGFGLTASYGELETEDLQILSLLKGVDISGKMYSLKPYLQYFVANNQAVGLRFDYSRGMADLNNLALDFSEDMSFALHDISYYQQGLSVSMFYRNYVGLDSSGIFGVFNEVDLGFGSGSSRFKRPFNGEIKDTRTISTKGSLNFSPGVCIFIQDFVSFNLSFGVFGLKWQKETQTTDGVPDGSRITSGANFRFNIFNINFGLMVVI